MSYLYFLMSLLFLLYPLYGSLIFIVILWVLKSKIRENGDHQDGQLAKYHKILSIACYITMTLFMSTLIFLMIIGGALMHKMTTEIWALSIGIPLVNIILFIILMRIVSVRKIVPQ
ncbi:hypothetical protein IC619_016210 [Hazenella sp. IB182353]|uniref:hypothetical protein n=1 Tax=Polycladospora coralii TaxID=2771432 RepID=UPI00174604C2|nr:hypothetical protein [Polycladospora coralii]MBS7531995.1 hypothetical protein [Polycladospora coralii]